MAVDRGTPSLQSSAPSSNRRARGRRLPLTASRETILIEEVMDALAASPAERIEAMVALLDSVYALWALRGLDRDQGLCRFPGITQQRRRGLCRDRRDGGAGAHPVSNDP